MFQHATAAAHRIEGIERQLALTWKWLSHRSKPTPRAARRMRDYGEPPLKRPGVACFIEPFRRQIWIRAARIDKECCNGEFHGRAPSL